MSKPINHSKPWIVEDRENLVAMVVAKYDWVMISNFLGRTLNATLAEFYRIANHPNEDEYELSKMVQPYKNCYNWKEGHTNPSDVEITEEVTNTNILEKFVGTHFFLSTDKETNLIYTVARAVLTDKGDIMVAPESGRLYYKISDCDFVIDSVNLD